MSIVAKPPEPDLIRFSDRYGGTWVSTVIDQLSGYGQFKFKFINSNSAKHFIREVREKWPKRDIEMFGSHVLIRSRQNFLNLGGGTSFWYPV